MYCVALELPEKGQSAIKVLTQIGHAVAEDADLEIQVHVFEGNAEQPLYQVNSHSCSVLAGPAVIIRG